MSVIEVENLFLPYSAESEENHLHNISFEIEKGELFSVLGISGSGKSTMARHLNALIKPQEGTVLTCGLDTSDEKNIAEIRKKCGMVFSLSRERFFTSNVIDEVTFALNCSGNEKKDVEPVLEYLGILGLFNKRIDELTEYQSLCVQIASVLTFEPEIIVFDDAAASIRGEDREKYFELLNKLNNDGKTIILFTNCYDEAALSERTLLLDKGHTAACGKTRDILTDRALLKKTGIEIPFSLRVYYDLLCSDIELKKPPLNMKELVDEICL